MKDRLLIFARAPRLGSVKTRLAGEIGNEQALAAYLQLLRTLCDNLQSIANTTLLISPDDAAPELREMVPSEWEIAGQGSGDLGARLERAFSNAFQESARVVVIGSDCPYVRREDVEGAFEALRENDLVVGPALDGGYWLLGLNRPQPLLFHGIPWSTPTVLADTVSRAGQLSLKTTLLRQLSDVDTAADWETFRASRAY